MVQGSVRSYNILATVTSELGHHILGLDFLSGRDFTLYKKANLRICCDHTKKKLLGFTMFAVC
uniref:Uncharacterized protein n=1 Tax=Arundo donax TaxID=35708 RepID=A0A0A9CI26_ARUDO